MNDIEEVLNNFVNALQEIKVTNDFEKAIDVISNCNGKIITVGMGKAGLAMKKFSATLCSLGISSCYLHPGEASHGDLGIIQGNDILFVTSTSGKTREVIETIDLSRKINSKPIIGLTSHKDSLLRDRCDIIIDMGEIEEAGKIKLAPTTSILVIIAIVDALSIVISERKGFNIKDFGRLHHSGYLGDVARESTKDVN